MKKMNLPNKLTMLRILLVPAVIACILIDFPFHLLAAAVLFGIASITDALDGKIARRDNLITDFGKFADPLADKILVISVLVCFVKLGLCGAVPLIIIIFREFAVTSVRLVAAAKGKVIAANMWGKVKTVSQIVAIGAIFLMQTALDIISLAMVGWVVPFGHLQSYNWTAYWTLDTIYNVFNIIGQVLIWIVAVVTVISGVKYLKDNIEVISDM
ncbi:CDP-diacylglycerol--glycerol-3-phosphate 3-phosphatidyltransferase [uncultured Ruminococcus sp.]|uniref:CDP-diacylglycerol--glycerol-3-phosphate 3-phosphatidyltransferase n=1 Tax=uncultured Ruminococcus sp. TaxID=165186 RepID=UPI00292DAFC7|nr:CDP-diacylglycerol--glycerol-3-phosphate 3-phosphatidyltransferase [uncultured Ruminococcus sp.]